MKNTRYDHVLSNRHGVTLLECIVTLAVLSMFFLGAYQVYSSTYRHFSVREAHLNLVRDSQRIMSSLAKDIRQAEILLPDYHTTTSYAVLLALKIRPTLHASSANTIVVYAIDRRNPRHLFRIVQAEEQTTSLELSPYLDTLDIVPETEKLLSVQLSLKETVAGRESTYHVSSAYAVRL